MNTAEVLATILIIGSLALMIWMENNDPDGVDGYVYRFRLWLQKRRDREILRMRQIIGDLQPPALMPVREGFKLGEHLPIAPGQSVKLRNIYSDSYDDWIKSALDPLPPHTAIYAQSADDLELLGTEPLWQTPPPTLESIPLTQQQAKAQPPEKISGIVSLGASGVLLSSAPPKPKPKGGATHRPPKRSATASKSKAGTRTRPAPKSTRSKAPKKS